MNVNYLHKLFITFDKHQTSNIMFYDELPDLPFPELKRLAISRRITKLIQWLDDRYTDFETQKDHIDQLVEYVEFVIDVLKQGIPKEDWAPFYYALADVRNGIIEELKDEATFHQAILGFRNTLLNYRAFIGTYEFEDLGVRLGG